MHALLSQLSTASADADKRLPVKIEQAVPDRAKSAQEILSEFTSNSNPNFQQIFDGKLEGQREMKAQSSPADKFMKEIKLLETADGDQSDNPDVISVEPDIEPAHVYENDSNQSDPNRVRVSPYDIGSLPKPGHLDPQKADFDTEDRDLVGFDLSYEQNFAQSKQPASATPDLNPVPSLQGTITLGKEVSGPNPVRPSQSPKTQAADTMAFPPYFGLQVSAGSVEEIMTKPVPQFGTLRDVQDKLPPSPPERILVKTKMNHSAPIIGQEPSKSVQNVFIHTLNNQKSDGLPPTSNGTTPQDLYTHQRIPQFPIETPRHQTFLANASGATVRSDLSPVSERTLADRRTVVEQVSLPQAPTTMTPFPINAPINAAMITGALRSMLSQQFNLVSPLPERLTVSFEEVASHPMSSAITQPGTDAIRAPLSLHIARQMAEVLQHLPSRPVEITLSPEELGRVRLSVTPSENGIVVNILAERPETLDLMRRHIDQLAQEFKSLGYDKIGFSFAQSGNDTSEDQNKNSTGDTSNALQSEIEAETAEQTHIHLSSGTAAGLDLRL